VASFLSSLRYLLADFIGEDDGASPFLPDGLSGEASTIVSDAIHVLIDYQGASYAQLYVDRINRFAGRQDVDAALVCEIARLMAVRMCYKDPIRIAQLKLSELEIAARAPSTDVKNFRLDELIGSLPAAAAGPVLEALEMVGWPHKRVSIPFSTTSRWGIRRLKLEAGLRRWRQFSTRYEEERVWVERWLHMIARSLAKQPGAAPAIAETATMIQGYGDVYRQGLADWHAIVDNLVKPTFDGGLPLSDLGGAIVEARAAVMPDPRQVSLKRAIALIRARALATGTSAAAE
jgi:Family of unknown function (DUF6537)